MVEHRAFNLGVLGSSPNILKNFSESGVVASAPVLGIGGHVFKSRLSDKNSEIV